MVLELKVSDYSRFCRRFKDLNIEIPESEGEIVVAMDSTGIKVTYCGDGSGRVIAENTVTGSRYMPQ